MKQNEWSLLECWAMQINEVNSLWPTRSDDSAQRGSIFWFIVIYRGDTILSLMGRLFCWGGSTLRVDHGHLKIT